MSKKLETSFSEDVLLKNREDFNNSGKLNLKLHKIQSVVKLAASPENDESKPGKDNSDYKSPVGATPSALEESAISTSGGCGNINQHAIRVTNFGEQESPSPSPCRNDFTSEIKLNLTRNLEHQLASANPYNL